MENGPAKKEEFARKIQASGIEFGDALEISTLRREDFDFIKSKK